MKNHTLTLEGGSGEALEIPAQLLRDALDALLEGADRALRFFIEGESTRRGPRPQWLDEAMEIHVRGLRKGSAVVVVDAPELQKEVTVPEEGFLFSGLMAQVPHASAIDLFGEVLLNTLNAPPDDVIADRKLLETCVRFARLSSRGYSGVVLGGIGVKSEPVHITLDLAPKLEALRDSTPDPREVRLCGILDTVSARRAYAELRTQRGDQIKLRLLGRTTGADRLRELFETTVVVSGTANFRVSGKISSIDVKLLEPASKADQETFAELPPLNIPQTLPELHDENAPSLRDIFGSWPGDETDQEFNDALEAVE